MNICKKKDASERLRSLFFVRSGFLVAMNCASVRGAMRIQDVFTLAKLLALFTVIVLGLAQLTYGNNGLRSAAYDFVENDRATSSMTHRDRLKKMADVYSVSFVVAWLSKDFLEQHRS